MKSLPKLKQLAQVVFNEFIRERDEIAQTVERLFWKANYILPPDMTALIRSGEEKEQSPTARAVLGTILENVTEENVLRTLLKM